MMQRASLALSCLGALQRRHHNIGQSFAEKPFTIQPYSLELMSVLDPPFTEETTGQQNRPASSNTIPNIS